MSTEPSEIPPPYVSDAHEEQVKTVLEDAVLSVHLLNQSAGRKVDGDPTTTYPQKQLELAKSASVAQLIWVPKDLHIEKIENQNYKAALDQLENSPREGADYDFMRGKPTTIASQIIEKLEQLQTASETAGDLSTILLDAHLKDQLHALTICRYFIENQIQSYINQQKDDPNENIDVFEAQLRDVSVLMILYGDVDANWVRQRQRRAAVQSYRSLGDKSVLCGWTPAGKGASRP